MANDSNSGGLIGAFLGGALMGALGALLLTPVKGSDLRTRIKEKLSQHSIILSDAEVDDIIARLEEDDEEFVC